MTWGDDGDDLERMRRFTKQQYAEWNAVPQKPQREFTSKELKKFLRTIRCSAAVQAARERVRRDREAP